MVSELNTELVWSLQALAQEADAQRSLYPDFVVVADELVLDFDEALSLSNGATQSQHSDLNDLNGLIESKSGLSEFWTDEALEQSAFWNEIRLRAKQALNTRGLATSLPPASSANYVLARDSETS